MLAKAKIKLISSAAMSSAATRHLLPGTGWSRSPGDSEAATARNPEEAGEETAVADRTMHEPKESFVLRVGGI